MMIFKLILLTIGILGFAFAAIGIKMFLQKGGMFKKSCSSVDSQGNRIGCECGGQSEDTCRND